MGPREVIELLYLYLNDFLFRIIYVTADFGIKNGFTQITLL